MKKTLLLTLALLFSVAIHAQNRISYISEHFDSDDFPAGWSFEGDCTADNWEIWKTHQAGGEPNEIKLYWKPSFDGIARMVSPALNLTDVKEVVVSFKGFLDNYQNVEHLLGIATTSDNGNTWNVAWQQSFANHNQGQHNFVQTIATSDMGKDNVKFSIFFNGYSGNINGWYFDDIEIYTVDKLNLGLLSLDMPEISSSNDNEIAFHVKNTGSDPITSFSISYQIDDNEAVIQDFETNLASLEEQTFSFQKKADIMPGSHNITVSILNVNDEEDVTSDNVISKEVNVAWCSLQRKPLIEHFSSSTCAPCVAVNEAMVLLTEKYYNQYTYTKYPVNFPSTGDPYYNEDCKTRKVFYNVLGAPTLFLDGDLYGNTFINDEDFKKQLDTPNYIDIKGIFNIDETDTLNININVDVLSFINLYQKRLHVAINEKTTTGNASYNGETEFHHIMIKMLPDANGTPIDLTAGEVQHFEFNYNMKDTFVEESSDLEVVVWVEDDYDYIVYSSNYLSESTTYAYPAQNLQLTYNETDKVINATWEAPEEGNPIGYNVYVNDKLTAENITETSLNIDNINGLVIIRVVAVYENNNISTSIYNHIYIEGETTDNESSISEESSFNIYPNPANNKIYIYSREIIEEINIYDIYGRRQQTTINSQQSLSIDVAGLNAGIYFIQINTEEGNIVKQFIKQ